MRQRLTPKTLVRITDREIPLVMVNDWTSDVAHIIRQEGEDKSGRRHNITLCNRVIQYGKTLTTTHELHRPSLTLCHVCSRRGNFEETMTEYREKWGEIDRQRKQKDEEKQRKRNERFARDQYILSAFLAKKFTLEEVGGKDDEAAIVTWRGRQFKIEIVPLEEEN